MKMFIHIYFSSVSWVMSRKLRGVSSGSKELPVRVTLVYFDFPNSHFFTCNNSMNPEHDSNL